MIIGFQTWALWTNFILIGGLILLAIIDHKYYLLPDCITLPLLWIGLLSNTFHLYIPIEQAVWGAMTGYLSLYLVATIYKYIRGIDGLGRGDCKLFAVFGAWWGPDALLSILVIASLTGSIIGTIQIILYKQNLKTYIPFGPYLILGAILTKALSY